MAVQPGAGRARDCRVSGAGRHGGGPRSGLHDRGLRRRRARADAIGRRGNGHRGEGGIRRHGSIGRRGGCARRVAAGLDRRRTRLHVLAQPARTGWIPGPPRHARTPRRGAHAPAARRDRRRADPARARVPGVAAPPRSARPRPPPRSDPRPSSTLRPAGCTPAIARRHDRAAARAGRRRRPARVAEPARGARARLRRLLERRPHGDHPQRVERRQPGDAST